MHSSEWLYVFSVINLVLLVEIILRQAQTKKLLSRLLRHQNAALRAADEEFDPGLTQHISQGRATEAYRLYRQRYGSSLSEAVAALGVGDTKVAK